MLRNSPAGGGDTSKNLLNEVLSLNAQESTINALPAITYPILNEVLSLNAQECGAGVESRKVRGLLNEVLSLNAQE